MITKDDIKDLLGYEGNYEVIPPAETPPLDFLQPYLRSGHFNPHGARLEDFESQFLLLISPYPIDRAGHKLAPQVHLVLKHVKTEKAMIADFVLASRTPWVLAADMSVLAIEDE